MHTRLSLSDAIPGHGTTIITEMCREHFEFSAVSTMWAHFIIVICERSDSGPKSNAWMNPLTCYHICLTLSHSKFMFICMQLSLLKIKPLVTLHYCNRCCLRPSILMTHFSICVWNLFICTFCLLNSKTMFAHSFFTSKEYYFIENRKRFKLSYSFFFPQTPTSFYNVFAWKFGIHTKFKFLSMSFFDSLFVIEMLIHRKFVNFFAWFNEVWKS